MSTGITNDPRGVPPRMESWTIEYTLNVSDHHALDTYVYDTILCKALSFRLRFYAVNLLTGGGWSVLAGLIVWGLIKLFALAESPPRHDPQVPLWAGLGAALLVFAIVLISIIPGSFQHRYARRANSGRFWLARRAQMQAGILRCPQHYRVVLSPEGFTETTTYRETGVAVEINEHKETRVWWAAVTRIDVGEERAFFYVFFNVKDKGWLIIPRSAFADDESFYTFVETAKSYRQAACAAPIPNTQPLAAGNTAITHKISG